MVNQTSSSLGHLLSASTIALFTAVSPGFADSIFTPAADSFPGEVSASSPEQGAPITAGSTAVIAGEGLIPGQTITLMRGNTVLTETPLTVDSKGSFSFEVEVDDEAAAGLQPVVAIAENPAAATVIELKISPVIPVSGEDKFDIKREPVTPGLYQVAYSDASKALFVTSAVGRPPVKESKLFKLDPETLTEKASATPEAAPAREDGSDAGVFALYGIDVDDANGNVWVTNTRQDTLAVYKQDDLSLVKQFESGTANHARDVAVDEANNRAYVSATGTDLIKVFDTKTFEELDPIEIQSQLWGKLFSTMSLDLDEENGILVTVSLNTPEAAIVDLKSGDVKVIALPGAVAASGVAYDPKEKLLFVASQGTDNLLILNAETGEVLHDVDTGSGALNVTFEPRSRLAYVANRSSGTITVVNTNGKIAANLDVKSYPNQLRADGEGDIYAVTKSRGENDPDGDQVWRLRLKD